MKESIRLEKLTVEKMIGMYCTHHHDAENEFCDECEALKNYAFERIAECPHLPDKPTCAKCTIHCYSSEKRVAIRKVMRYAGPRMIWHHPVLAVRHLVKSMRLFK